METYIEATGDDLQHICDVCGQKYGHSFNLTKQLTTYRNKEFPVLENISRSDAFKRYKKQMNLNLNASSHTCMKCCEVFARPDSSHVFDHIKVCKRKDEQ